MKASDIIGSIIVTVLGAALVFCVIMAGMAQKREANDHRMKIRESIDGCALLEMRVGVKEPAATWTCEGGRWVEISEDEARNAGIWPL